ncbi:hypothetical protein ACRALDRAFT_1047302 [Sodiomyces alcalophilus JCM 7366]|uniref:uncharacterized protein n=1 Tax=Sodiomyces alcalophilus JCM 7366 TaxID=591952 RepID=UPI0039B519D4
MDEEKLVKLLEEVVENVADDTHELIVASAALFISVVALFAALLQVAQQYYASATGYAHCDAKVVGEWSQSKSRIFRPYEFRFEVQYESPVIFLCRPENKKGPLKNKAIWRLDGSKESQKNTWSVLKEEAAVPADVKKTNTGSGVEMDTVSADAKKMAEKAVHTADNELATWVPLLLAIQRMERDSREWQRKRLVPAHPPRSGESVRLLQPGRTYHDVEARHTLVVALQKKTRSWDTMPAGVRKPFATTTWCHMIEMAAVLGIYWIEFDRSRDSYRAEGNGYMLTAEKVPDLGITFTFQTYGENKFEENRTIPVEEVKDLSFGAVPTIYRVPGRFDSRRLGFDDDRQDLSMLSLASRAEIAETLSIIGCNTNTVNYFAKDETSNCRVAHLFPLPFEIVGMLSRTLHIEHSVFRLLPNPTIFPWKMKNFSLREILNGYLAQVGKEGVLSNKDSPVVKAIRHHGRTIQREIRKGGASASSSVVLLDVLHGALDDTDEVLTGKTKEDRATTKATRDNRPHAQVGAATTNTSSTNDTSETESERLRRQKVQDVLRSHIQEVLSVLNEKSFEMEADCPHVAVLAVPGGLSSSPFEVIDAAAPEDRPEKLMEIYFDVVRKRVVGSAAQSTNRRESMVGNPHAPPPVPGIRRRATARSTVAPDSDCGSDHDSNEGSEVSEPDELWHLSTAEISHEDIWCTLVFRMICWLMLHDFHPKDVQITKSELRGSRLPIYIA